MTYEIQQIVPEPVMDGVRLQVDGETVATARHDGGCGWLLMLPGTEDIFVDLRSEAHARRVLEWIGERMSPRVFINSREDLHLGKPGVIYWADYNGGNRYRIAASGRWYFKRPDAADWIECENGRPYIGAYPLTEMR